MKFGKGFNPITILAGALLTYVAMRHPEYALQLQQLLALILGGGATAGLVSFAYQRGLETPVPAEEKGK